MDKTLTWEDSYAIALTLIQKFPARNLEEVSLGMIYKWVIGLPEFVDDPVLANDEILTAIYQIWIEEAYNS